MKNTHSNQIIRADSLLILMAVVVVVSFALRPLWKDRTEDVLAQSILHAESLAYQVLQIQNEIAKRDGRFPAAIDSSNVQGQIGLDPWGQPFLFQTHKDAAGRVAVEVWSASWPNKTRVKTR